MKAFAVVQGRDKQWEVMESVEGFKDRAFRSVIFLGPSSVEGSHVARASMILGREGCVAHADHLVYLQECYLMGTKPIGPFEVCLGCEAKVTTHEVSAATGSSALVAVDKGVEWLYDRLGLVGTDRTPRAVLVWFNMMNDLEAEAALRLSAAPQECKKGR